MSCFHPFNLGTQFVPCGKCLGCLEDRQKIWYFRNVIEFNYNSVNSFFVTLTYADEHLPLSDKFEQFDANNSFPVLDHAQFQKFVKRLRKRLPKFRYYMVSEYSPSPENRPHFHCIMYFKEIVPLETIYREVVLSWTVPDTKIPLGGVNIERLSFGRICYVTQYLLVKVFNDTYDDLPQEFRPKAFMSRRPGIGDRTSHPALVQWFREHPFEGVMYFPDGSPMAIPRYFRNKMIPPTARFIVQALNRVNHMGMKIPDQFTLRHEEDKKRIQIRNKYLRRAQHKMSAYD